MMDQEVIDSVNAMLAAEENMLINNTPCWCWSYLDNTINKIEAKTKMMFPQRHDETNRLKLDEVETDHKTTKMTPPRSQTESIWTKPRPSTR